MFLELENFFKNSVKGGGINLEDCESNFTGSLASNVKVGRQGERKICNVTLLRGA
jgi:hypothetical protein